MKRTFTLLFAYMCCLTAMAFEAESNGLWYEFNSGTKEAKVIKSKGTAYAGVIKIPETVSYNGETYSVKTIDNHAFANCNDLTFVAIPDQVQRIGDYAFHSCVSLDSVSIGKSVVEIGERAFFDCKSIEYATLPNSVTTIGNSAFSGCINLTSVFIPDNVKYVADETFMNCTKLEYVTIGEGVTAIGSCAFQGCSLLMSLTLGRNVNRIGSSAFWGCSDLRMLTIPNSVTSIGSGAFGNCTLISVTSLIMEPFTIEGKNSLNRIFSENTFNNATLYVPLGTIDKYKATEGWKDFAQILTVHGLDYDYRPFLERGKRWLTGIPNPDGEGYKRLFEYFSFSRDTVFNGRSCVIWGRSELREYGGGSYAALDTVYVGALYEQDRKVYHVSPGSQEFKLLYDFASPAGSEITIAGNDYAIVSKEPVQYDDFKGECIHLQAMGLDQPAICWLEGVGSKGNPLDNLVGDNPSGMSNEILISCSLGNEVLYTKFDIGGNVKRNTIDFTHVVKTRPKAPRSLTPDPSPVGEGSEETENLTGEFSLEEIILKLKHLSGSYTITLLNSNGIDLYRKTVQTSNVVAFRINTSSYRLHSYMLRVENDEEAYTASINIDDITGIKPLPLTPGLTPDPSPKGEGSAKREGGAGAWYDLSGRQITRSSLFTPHSSLPKGVYIKDGKKVVVR